MELYNYKKQKGLRLFVKLKNESHAHSVINILKEGQHQIVLCPLNFAADKLKFHELECNENVEIYYLKESPKRKEFWDFALFTSGSTGKPKLYGYTQRQLEDTLEEYMKIYNVSNDSLVVSTLPFSYNFTYVAGYMLEKYCNLSYKHFENLANLVVFIEKNKNKYDRVIILANPIMMNDLYKYSQHLQGNITIDCGGALLSNWAIQWYWDQGINLREGYGLTETCSLSHFDSERNKLSLGTVGTERTNINTSIVNINDKPIIKMESKDCFGLYLDEKGNIHPSNMQFNGSLITGDIGKLDNNKRLTILGRESDNKINNLWPKDILNLIAHILGTRCALIMTPTNEEVFIKTWETFSNHHKRKINEILLDTLNIKQNNINYVKNKSLCHSLKLSRHINI